MPSTGECQECRGMFFLFNGCVPGHRDHTNLFQCPGGFKVPRPKDKDDLYGDREGRVDDNAWGSVPAVVDGQVRAIRGICVDCELPLDRCDCGVQ